MSKKKVSVSLDADLLSYLDGLGYSRSKYLNSLLRRDFESSSGVGSNISILDRLTSVETRVHLLEDSLVPASVPVLSGSLPDDGPSYVLQLFGSDSVPATPDISSLLPGDVDKDVREWVEFRLESKGYIRWKDDQASWEALEVGDSRRSFSSYMKDCGLMYVRKGNQWVLPE